MNKSLSEMVIVHLGFMTTIRIRESYKMRANSLRTLSGVGKSNVSKGNVSHIGSNTWPFLGYFIL